MRRQNERALSALITMGLVVMGGAFTGCGEVVVASVSPRGGQEPGGQGGASGSDSGSSTGATGGGVAAPAWSLVNPTPTSRAFYAIGGTSEADIWAAGEKGTIQHWDGVAWVSHDREAGDLSLIWVNSANDVWVAGNQDLLHWDGKSWATTFTVPMATALWASGSSNVWVAQNEDLHRWNGESFELLSYQHTSTIRAIWGSQPDDVWAVGDNGTLLHFDGLEWKPFDQAPISETVDPLAASNRYVGIWGFAHDDVWAAFQYLQEMPLWSGPAAKIGFAHFDGNVWSVVHTEDELCSANDTSRVLIGTPEGEVHMLGCWSSFRWDGHTWSKRSNATTSDSGSSTAKLGLGLVGTKLFATGRPGTVFEFDALAASAEGAEPGDWVRAGALSHGLTSTLWSAVAAGAGDVMALAYDYNDGEKLYYKVFRGSTSGWKPASSPFPVPELYYPTSLWAAAADDVWVGMTEDDSIDASKNAGEILHWNGVEWTTTPTALGVLDIAGSQAGGTWAVGHSGSVQKWAGATWKTIPWTANTSHPDLRLTSVHVRDAQSVWIAGVDDDSDYVVAHSDGASLTEVFRVAGPSPIGSPHVWAVADDDVWLGGRPSYHWDGTEWTSVAELGDQYVWDIAGTDSGELWILVGGDTFFRAKNGILERDQETFYGAYSIAGTGSSDIWLVGAYGATWHFGLDGLR